VKLIFTYIAVASFALIGVVAFAEHNYKVGVATIMLAVANALLLL
jgi:hypothetical protein